MSGNLFTIPSRALFALLVPFTGLSRTTAEVGLVAYTILILVRNTSPASTASPTRCEKRPTAWGGGAVAINLANVGRALPSLAILALTQQAIGPSGWPGFGAGRRSWRSSPWPSRPS